MWKRWTAGIAAAGIILTGCGTHKTVSADAVAEMETETKYIALTFDDGPRRGTTDRLLDGLQALGASATFFLVGEQAVAAPDLVRRMKAEGHQVGNHTWSHARLTGDPETIRTEIETMDRLLAALLGEGAYWLRPPYGFLSAEAETFADVPLIKWSVDPRDWESREKNTIVREALRGIEPNSIVLLHDIYPASVDAALELVEILQREGYWFVTVEELLRLNGNVPQAGVWYRTGEQKNPPS